MYDVYGIVERKDGRDYYPHKRKIKKYESAYSQTYVAWIKGVGDKENGRSKNNRYPTGHRHTAYERGYAQERGE